MLSNVVEFNILTYINAFIEIENGYRGKLRQKIK